MLSLILKLAQPTGRASLVAVIVAVVSLLGSLGIVVPSGTSNTIQMVVNTVLVFVATVLGGSALHKSPPPVAK